MATTQTSKEYVGTGDGVNGSDLTWTYTFQSYQSADIKVKVTDSTGAFIDVTNYTVPDWTTSGGTVTFNNTGVNSNVCESTGAPKSNRTIRIYRETGITTGVVGQIDPKHTYAAGSSVKAGDLNNNQKQVIYAIHELRDQERITVNVRNSAITGTKIKDDEIDSQHYAAGSIDLEHMSANSVDSDQYVDGSVDLIHLSANSVDSSKIVDGSIVNADINASAAIAGSKIAPDFGSQAVTTTGNIVVGGTVDGRDVAADGTKLDGIEANADVTDATNVNAAGAVMNSDLDTKGEILVGDGSGDPTALSVGTNDYVLTADSSTATGVAWKAASGGGAAITIQDEGSSLSTAAETINFTGAGVVASGTGVTKTITIAGGGGGGAVTTDYQYLELKAHNNASGAFSAGSADYELVTKGTNTAVTPAQAAALLINIAGVIQEPNTGTSIGSNDGFCIDGSSIHFGANLTAHPDYIIWMKGSGEVSALANDSVTTAKIAASQVTNAKIADDTIAEAKLDIHNAPSGTDKYLKYTSNGMEWATAGSGTPEGTAILSTGESGGTKFLREDGDGSCSWQSVPSGVTQENVEDWVGGMVTGNTETGITVTYEDSDGTLDFAVASQTDNNFTTTLKNKLDGIAASANAYVHPNHSGEVTSTADGATVIADNVVDEANLKVSNAPTNGQVLVARSGNTGGMTWEASPAPSFEIFEHANALSANKTIGTNNNALVAGPFSTGTYTLTIPSGSVFTVV